VFILLVFLKHISVTPLKRSLENILVKELDVLLERSSAIEKVVLNNLHDDLNSKDLRILIFIFLVISVAFILLFSLKLIG
jgi:hypothetical protein